MNLKFSCCPCSVGVFLSCLQLLPVNGHQSFQDGESKTDGVILSRKNNFHFITFQALEAIDEVGDILQLKYSKQKNKNN